MRSHAHTKDQSQNAPRPERSHITLKSLRSYPRPTLCQRNPFPIQIPPTYNHSHHSRGNNMTPVTRIHKRPISKCTRPEPLLLLPSDHLDYTSDRPSAKGILSQFKFLPPTDTPATIGAMIRPGHTHKQKANLKMHPTWTPRVLALDG